MLAVVRRSVRQASTGIFIFEGRQIQIGENVTDHLPGNFLTFQARPNRSELKQMLLMFRGIPSLALRN